LPDLDRLAAEFGFLLELFPVGPFDDTPWGARNKAGELIAEGDESRIPFLNHMGRMLSAFQLLLP
jgi:hypothetical protein